MGRARGWQQKLDAYSRMQLEEGLPAEGIDVTVRLDCKEADAPRQVVAAGLQLHAQVGEVVVGHVASSTDLEHLAELPCVQEVQLSRPLYEDRPGPAGKEK